MAVIKKLCNVNITSLLTSHHRNIVSKRFNGLNTRQLSNFPSFSTNDSEDFITKPSLKVAADIIVKGAVNQHDLSSAVLKKLEQTPKELMEGSLTAVQLVTQIIEQTFNMNKDISPKLDINTLEIKDFLTDDCYDRLSQCYPDILNAGNTHLINTPREDIFFSWIEKLRADSNGSFIMTVCTLSFPNYGPIISKLKDNVERQKQFMKDTKANTPNFGNLGKEEVDELKNAAEKIRQSLYDPKKDLASHEIVVSNFTFKHGPGKDDQWLIGDIGMKGASEAMSALGRFRWRGRMYLSMRGYSIINILRIDYFTDYFLLLGIFFLMIFANKL